MYEDIKRYYYFFLSIALIQKIPNSSEQRLFLISTSRFISVPDMQRDLSRHVR